jgi:hypothetical protein
MANYRVISSDNHVFEPPDLWTSRAKPEFKDRVPQLVREYDGDWWFCNGHRVIGPHANGNIQILGRRPQRLVHRIVVPLPLRGIDGDRTSRPTGRAQGRILRSRTATACATRSWLTPTTGCGCLLPI